MTQAELGQLLEPYTGTVWSRQNLGSAESGRRGWTANDVLAISMLFQVPITELFTPLPDQPGDIRTTGGAVVTQAELSRRTARPAAIAPTDATRLVQAAERLSIMIRTFLGSVADGHTPQLRKEDDPDGTKETTL
jgi:hypothetical protein